MRGSGKEKALLFSQQRPFKVPLTPPKHAARSAARRMITCVTMEAGRKETTEKSRDEVMQNLVASPTGNSIAQMHGIGTKPV